MIKNYIEFNESLKDLERKYNIEFKIEVDKILNRILNFCHEINDILASMEDESGDEYYFDQITIQNQHRSLNYFRIDLEKNSIKSFDGDLFYERDVKQLALILDENSTVFLLIDTDEMLNKNIKIFEERVKSMYPFTEIKYLDPEFPRAISFKIGDLK